jgi:hypothetical protein
LTAPGLTAAAVPDLADPFNGDGRAATNHQEIYQ